jgi:hypothetical protein
LKIPLTTNFLSLSGKLIFSSFLHDDNTSITIAQ